MANKKVCLRSQNTMNDGIFLLLGSNQGDKAQNLAFARENIEAQAGNIILRSSLYKSPAWGLEQQPDFVNQVLKIASARKADDLLTTILGIEELMGRVRVQKWGPRVIDIDLLFYGDEVRNSVRLHLPHPRIAQRRFTLVPLAEIAPQLVHPVLKKSISQLLDECNDPLMVDKIT